MKKGISWERWRTFEKEHGNLVFSRRSIPEFDDKKWISTKEFYGRGLDMASSVLLVTQGLVGAFGWHLQRVCLLHYLFQDVMEKRMSLLPFTNVYTCICI